MQQVRQNDRLVGNTGGQTNRGGQVKKPGRKKASIGRYYGKDWNE